MNQQKTNSGGNSNNYRPIGLNGLQGVQMQLQGNMTGVCQNLLTEPGSKQKSLINEKSTKNNNQKQIRHSSKPRSGVVRSASTSKKPSVDPSSNPTALSSKNMTKTDGNTIGLKLQQNGNPLVRPTKTTPNQLLSTSNLAANEKKTPVVQSGHIQGNISNRVESYYQRPMQSLLDINNSNINNANVYSHQSLMFNQPSTRNNIQVASSNLQGSIPIQQQVTGLMNIVEIENQQQQSKERNQNGSRQSLFIKNNQVGANAYNGKVVAPSLNVPTQIQLKSLNNINSNGSIVSSVEGSTALSAQRIKNQNEQLIDVNTSARSQQQRYGNVIRYRNQQINISHNTKDSETLSQGVINKLNNKDPGSSRQVTSTHLGGIMSSLNENYQNDVNTRLNTSAATVNQSNINNLIHISETGRLNDSEFKKHSNQNMLAEIQLLRTPNNAGTQLGQQNQFENKWQNWNRQQRNQNVYTNNLLTGNSCTDSMAGLSSLHNPQSTNTTTNALTSTKSTSLKIPPQRSQQRYNMNSSSESKQGSTQQKQSSYNLFEMKINNQPQPAPKTIIGQSICANSKNQNLISNSTNLLISQINNKPQQYYNQDIRKRKPTTSDQFQTHQAEIQTPNAIKTEVLNQVMIMQNNQQMSIHNANSVRGVSGKGPNEIITIHVFDENRKKSQDFKCQKSLLVRYMKYFEKYLTDNTSGNDIDISVHCDVKIFDWLVKYIYYRSKNVTHQGFAAKHVQYKKKTNESPVKVQEIGEQPIMDLKNVISVLISSDFLQMKELVEECISYVVANLHDVVRLPIDMCCLNTDLIRRISMKVPMKKLSNLLDKRDKLTSKLFQKKLERMLYLLQITQTYNTKVHNNLWQGQIWNAFQEHLENPSDVNVYSHAFDDQYDVNGFIDLEEKEADPQTIDNTKDQNNKLNTLNLCSQCDSLFLQSSSANHCPKAKQFVDFYGSVQAHHVLDKHFDLIQFLQNLSHNEHLKWKEIFWKVWAALQEFNCLECNQRFYGHDLNGCSYHPGDIKQPDTADNQNKKEDDLEAQNKYKNNGAYSCCGIQIQKFSMFAGKEQTKGCTIKVHSVNGIDKNEELQIPFVMKSQRYQRQIELDVQILEIYNENKYIACPEAVPNKDQSPSKQLEEKYPVMIPVNDLQYFVNAFIKENRLIQVKKVKTKKQQKDDDKKKHKQNALEIPPELMNGIIQNKTKEATISNYGANKTHNKRRISVKKPSQKRMQIRKRSISEGSNRSKKSKRQLVIESDGEQEDEEDDEDRDEAQESEENDEDEAEEGEEEENDEDEEESQDEDYDSEQEMALEVPTPSGKNFQISYDFLRTKVQRQRTTKKKDTKPVINSAVSTAVTASTEQETQMSQAEQRLPNKRNSTPLHVGETPLDTSQIFSQQQQQKYGQLSDYSGNHPNLQFRQKREMLKFMYQKKRGPIQQRPQITHPIPTGFVSEEQFEQSYKVPSHIKGQLGFLGGQIRDPFEKISREDRRKRQNWRRDYLVEADSHQYDDLANLLKRMRVPEGNNKKRKRAIKEHENMMQNIDKKAEDKLKHQKEQQIMQKQSQNVNKLQSVLQNPTSVLAMNNHSQQQQNSRDQGPMQISQFQQQQLNPSQLILRKDFNYQKIQRK